MKRLAMSSEELRAFYRAERPQKGFQDGRRNPVGPRRTGHVRVVSFQERNNQSCYVRVCMCEK